MNGTTHNEPPPEEDDDSEENRWSLLRNRKILVGICGECRTGTPPNYPSVGADYIRATGEAFTATIAAALGMTVEEMRYDRFRREYIATGSEEALTSMLESVKPYD